MPPPEPKNIRLSGPEWTPPGYDKASAELRRRWWAQLASVAYAVKREEILDGIGADGRKLKPVESESRHEGGSGPPLAPHGVSSRTYRLFKYASGKDGATLYWVGGWKTIVGYHAYKHGPRSLPVRDTIGISPRGRKRAFKLTASLWRAWQAAEKAKVAKESASGSRKARKDIGG